MRLGLIARADNSGLGMQTWEFYRHMVPQKTMVVDISHLNGNLIFPERYPDGIFIKGFPTKEDIDSFLQDLDVVFVAESPYNYYLYGRAKELKVKVAVQYNYEFFDWFVHPDYPTPDLLIAPSKWHYNYVDIWADANNVKHTYLHCPVNTQALPPREITQARNFLHVAGRSASHDRNGTKIAIAASSWLQTEAKIIIHFQGEQGLAHQTTMTTKDYEALARDIGDPKKLIIVKHEFEHYADIYAMGDVLVMPRRYGGNCLPLNEALAVGLPAIMTDISPNNDFLPQEWLIPAHKIGDFEPRTVIDIYDSRPKDLAAKIDQFYSMSEEAMAAQNSKARGLGRTISWDVMRLLYTEAFEELVA